MEIFEMTALETAKKIKSGEISCRDAVESVAKSINARDEKFNCYTHFDWRLQMPMRHKSLLIPALPCLRLRVCQLQLRIISAQRAI